MLQEDGFQSELVGNMLTFRSAIVVYFGPYGCGSHNHFGTGTGAGYHGYKCHIDILWGNLVPATFTMSDGYLLNQLLRSQPTILKTFMMAAGSQMFMSSWLMWKWLIFRTSEHCLLTMSLELLHFASHCCILQILNADPKSMWNLHRPLTNNANQANRHQSALLNHTFICCCDRIPS